MRESADSAYAAATRHRRVIGIEEAQHESAIFFVAGAPIDTACKIVYANNVHRASTRLDHLTLHANNC